MKYGRAAGVFFMIVGMIISFLNMKSGNPPGFHFPNFVFAGPAATIAGMFLIIFPGGVVSRDAVEDGLYREIWKAAPILHRVMWIVGFIVACLAGMICQLVLTGRG
jgi:membrane-associated PAP2 superfamily phosphatase